MDGTQLSLTPKIDGVGHVACEEPIPWNSKLGELLSKHTNISDSTYWERVEIGIMPPDFSGVVWS